MVVLLLVLQQACTRFGFSLSLDNASDAQTTTDSAAAPPDGRDDEGAAASDATDASGSPIDQQQLPPPDSSSPGDLSQPVVDHGPGGLPLWSRIFGGVGSDFGINAALDPSGNLYVTGHVTDAVDFGSGPLANNGGWDIFIASFSPSGVLRWAKAFGDSGDDFAHAVATDASGDVYLTGSFVGTVDFGKGPLTSKGFSDLVVAKFSAAGAPLWAEQLGGPGNDEGHCIATDAQGNVYVTGRFSSAVDFGGELLTALGTYDILVLSLTSSGALRWVKQYGDGNNEIGYGIAADKSSNVYVTGFFPGTVDFGAGAIATRGNSDIFLLSLDTSGSLRWAKTFGGTATDVGRSVATDSASNVYVTGTFMASSDFGAGDISSKGLNDVFLLSVSSAGAYRWATAVGGASNDSSANVTVGPDNVYVTGFFNQTVDFGSGPFTANQSDLFVISLTAGDGAFDWVKTFGLSGNDQGTGLALGDAALFVTGYFSGAIDLGDGQKTSQGTDLFVLSLAP